MWRSPPPTVDLRALAIVRSPMLAGGEAEFCGSSVFERSTKTSRYKVMIDRLYGIVRVKYSYRINEIDLWPVKCINWKSAFNFNLINKVVITFFYAWSCLKDIATLVIVHCWNPNYDNSKTIFRLYVKCYV